MSRARRVPRPAVGRAGAYAALLTRQFHVTLVLAAAIGVLTGLGVAGFDHAVESALGVVLEAPLVAVAIVPAVGLAVVGAAGTRWGGGDTTTTDAYVRAYHERGGAMSLRQLWWKLSASAATLGTGSALGLEGPSIVIGSTIGSTVERRLAGLRRDDAKVLMVAGAAAGVAAVFKAPLTGVVFALEVPYRADLARRALLPALVAAGTGYVTYVAFAGTAPVLATWGSAPFDLRDLGGALLLGLVCGVLARAGAWAIGHAKHVPLPTALRIAVAALTLALLAPVAESWFGQPLHLGPGYAAIDWAVDDDRTLLALAALFAVRALATWLCVGAGGVGGLFIPLVTQGAVVGSFVQQLVDTPNPRLLPTVGIAAFLGAGYRTPLAGVAFVAEATGEPGFLVPALLAAAASQLVMGRLSFSQHQRLERLPDVEPLTRLPVGDIMTPSADVIGAERTVEDAVVAMTSQNRRWAPVAEGRTYVGLVALKDLAAIPRTEWRGRHVRDVARTDVMPAAPEEPVSAVAERLRASAADAAAVTTDGSIVGVVTLRDLGNVEVLLDRMSNEATPM